MASSFDIYTYYLAIKQHFTRESYDFFKYHGRVSASARAFESRRDKYYFDKLAKVRDAKGFILANVSEKPSVWIGELVGSEAAEVTYKRWLKRNQSLSYSFSDELGRLDEKFNANFVVEQGTHPNLLKLYLRSVISLETLIILVHMTGCYNKWCRAMEYDPVWDEVSMRIRKYQPFMKYDIDKLKEIVVNKFSENEDA